MSDLERIVQAIEVLTQKVTNLQNELTGLRADLTLHGRHQNDQIEAHKKKLNAFPLNSITPWWNLPSSKHGKPHRRGVTD